MEYKAKYMNAMKEIKRLEKEAAAKDHKYNILHTKYVNLKTSIENEKMRKEPVVKK